METWRCSCGTPSVELTCAGCGAERPGVNDEFEQLMAANGISSGEPRRYAARGMQLPAGAWIGYFLKAAEIVFAWHWPARHLGLLRQSALHLRHLLELGTSVWGQLPDDEILRRIEHAGLTELFAFDEELAVTLMLIADLHEHMRAQGFEAAAAVTRTEIVMVEYIHRAIISAVCEEPNLLMPLLPDPVPSHFPALLAAVLDADRYLEHGDDLTDAARVLVEAALAGTFLAAGTAAQIFPAADTPRV
jgi:hypothetical protein